ncbi:hypothetical protein QBZ16_003757 [Prototheca wickerhamii]|uniref:Uncharacterized protein n=1 Tax=Prototheca wickerhamii TaxID=3111 RepID=A0AAD9IIS2_PROWI|nr:hypothetical protein QBZ16_003757 [Prototheca wickerhamii]
MYIPPTGPQPGYGVTTYRAAPAGPSHGAFQADDRHAGKSKDPLLVITRWFKSRNPREKMYMGVAGGIVALLLMWLVIEDHDSLFVASEGVHFVGIGVLAYKIIRKRNCGGLSLRTQELTALFLAIRLFCSFMMEYDIHTVLDLLTLAATCWVIYTLRGPLHESYQKQQDTLSYLVVLVPCLLLAAVAHPGTRHSFVFRLMWAFCVYLEAVSVLPQLRMMQKAKVVEKFTAHYVFALGLSRFIFDGDKYLWMALGSGVWPVMVLLSEIIQTGILADFCYYYIKSYAEGSGTVRLYDAAEGKERRSIVVGVPLLAACPADEGTCFSAGLDGKIRRHEWAAPEGETGAVLGQHREPARCVLWLAQQGLVASAGWDARLCLWRAAPLPVAVEDLENQAAAAQAPLAELALPGKAYSMSLSGSRLVVATSERHLLVVNLAGFDPSNPASLRPEQLRESPLKHQTRTVAGFPDATGFAVGSIEGKLALEFFEDQSSGDAMKKSFSFKCHREKDAATQSEVIYPVNAVSFHLRFGTFATGGGDGNVYLWDGESKSRLKSLRGYPTSISALAFSASGTRLAVAASYAFEKGDIEHPADGIYVRSVADEEVLPKSKKAAAA